MWELAGLADTIHVVSDTREGGEKKATCLRRSHAKGQAKAGSRMDPYAAGAAGVGYVGIDVLEAVVRAEDVDDLVFVELLERLTSWTEVLTWVEVQPKGPFLRRPYVQQRS